MLTLTAIGIVHSTRAVPDDDGWDAIATSVELDASFGADALSGLDEFSHVEIIYVMDRVQKIEVGARHPRGNPDWPKVGIFAQRAKDRPNRLGVTVCRLDRVDGKTLHLTGLDAIDGTPVVDIKPWVREFAARGEVRQPQWVGELMANYW